MKKIIIAGAALAAISVFTVSAFAADTSNETNASVPYASNTQSSQCTQEYCPQDGTGNRYGADNGNKNTNGKNGSCNGCQSETCTNSCNGSQQRLRLYSEK